MKAKVERLLKKLDEVEEKLFSPDIVSNQQLYKALTQEHSYLLEVKEAWSRFILYKEELEKSYAMQKEEMDPEFLNEISEEIKLLEASLEKEKHHMEKLLIPPNPNDNRNCILELRAGTGGDEAALFVGDCVRMYKLYAEKFNWKMEEISSTPSISGGFKEYVMALSGKNVYRHLKYEGGAHRVQRVPETETQGRIHTSVITVAVLPEPDEKAAVTLDEKDLRIDTFRSSGAGGQHVNVTDSAVRITHIPTGIVVSCQQERSQHKNKDKCLRLLQAKIAEAEEEKRLKEQQTDRLMQVGAGDRSSKIRTYNFPQNRVTDHRINLTLYCLDRVMSGALDDIISALVSDAYQKSLQT
jgi:peptide chain release factor 1